ncbi:MAG: protocatechuate 3,4-dioxygenase [Rhodospirillales bacterium]|nr:protocatechuate 3,4-dioxygenase [Rhodospirillales bacterium]
MAEIVLGVGTSHSPMLSLDPEHWDIRTQADRDEPAHPYRGGTYSFDELMDVRPTAEFTKQNAIEKRRENYARCQVGLDALGDKINEVDPDVLVVIGDDQEDWFLSDVLPAFTVYYGATVYGEGFDPNNPPDDMPLPMVPVRSNYRPLQDTNHPTDAALGLKIIERAIEDEFDVTISDTPPHRGEGPIGIGHAFEFINRRILKDRVVASVPILINTYYPPNQPSAKRCFEFGRSIGRAISEFDRDCRVGVVASGGLTHFAIDEEVDRRLIEAMRAGDVEAFAAEPAHTFLSGTSEIKNWIALSGALSETGFQMNLIDYVPCYRSDAGTGTAMGFATWD